MKIKKLILTATVISAFSINNSQAAGFAADLHSTSGLANSYAGAVTGNHDISDSFTNPAILSDVNNNELVLSVSYLDMDIDDENANAVRGSLFGSGAVTGSRNNDGGVDNAILPAFYYANRIDNKMVFGFNVTSPFGLSTKYDENWIGRYHAIESDIKTVNINPSISYQVNDKLSIGAGLQAQYIKAVLTKAVLDSSLNDNLGKLKGDDWGYGFNLGAKYQINDKTKVAIGYRSKIQHKLEGKSQVQGMGLISEASAGLSTPESLTFGASYDLNDKVELLSDVSWTRWSRIQTIDVVAPQSTTLDNDDLTFNFKDSWRYSLGLNYKLNSQFKIRTGTAYEEGANSSSTYRTPRIPTGDRIWTTLGFEYKIDQDMKIDASYSHQFYKKTSTNIAATSQVASLNTEYKMDVDVFAIGFGWKF